MNHLMFVYHLVQTEENI